MKMERLENNKNLRYLYRFTTICFSFLLSLIVISPVIGVIFSCLNLSWGIFSIILIFMCSIVLTYYLQKLKIFAIDNLKNFLLLMVLMVFVLFLYKKFSPVLSIQQDQALYMFRALNLINYGTIEKPMTTLTSLINEGVINNSDLFNYGYIENGTQLLDGYLNVDFYPGGSYFFALVGSFSRRYVFYGQTLIMLANAFLLYSGIRFITKEKDSISALLYSVCFFVSPIILWFGRSSSTEPTALFFWLLIFTLLLDEEVNNWVLVLVFSVSIIARIDYMLVAILGIFIMTYRKPTFGFATLITTSIFSYILSQKFWIYYNRISIRDFKLIKYQIALYILAFVASYIITRYLKEHLLKLYYSKFIKWCLILGSFLVVLLIFRDNITPSFFYGKFTEFGLNMRSYEENIMENLTLAFPIVVLLIGIVATYKIVESKKKVNFLAGLFLLGLMVPYFYFLYKSGNAPQMYFLLRRYYNILIPSVTICFVLFMDNTPKDVKYIVAVVVCIMSTNLYANSKQKVEYKGLNYSVDYFVSTYNEEDIQTIYYDNEFKIEFSPIVSYGKYDFVPLSSNDEKINAIEAYQQVENKTSLYITMEPIEGIEAETFYLIYSRMGENYEELPKEYYNFNDTFYVYQLADILKLGVENIFIEG